MGLFFTLYYLEIFVAPVIAGNLSEAAGAADVAFTFGGGALIASFLLLGLFRVFARRAGAALAK